MECSNAGTGLPRAFGWAMVRRLVRLPSVVPIRHPPFPVGCFASVARLYPTLTVFRMHIVSLRSHLMLSPPHHTSNSSHIRNIIPPFFVSPTVQYFESFSHAFPSLRIVIDLLFILYHVFTFFFPSFTLPLSSMTLQLPLLSFLSMRLPFSTLIRMLFVAFFNARACFKSLATFLYS